MSVADLRARVLTRDGGCIAWAIDPASGPCFDRWGNLLTDAESHELEMDYVRRGARGRHHELECDHVALCAGHHRGSGPHAGMIWATRADVRIALRDYLDRLYPNGPDSRKM